MTTEGWQSAITFEKSSELRLITSVEQPSFGEDFVTADPNNKWSLAVGQLTFGWSTVQERIKTAAFSSLLGLLLTDGAVIDKAQLYLGHELDAKQASDAIFVVTGTRPSYGFIEADNLYFLNLPRFLVDALVNDLGLPTGSHIDSTYTLPAFLSKSDCPVGVIREFLAGLFGGNGSAPYISRKEASQSSLRCPVLLRVALKLASRRLRSTLKPLLNFWPALALQT